ncbi:MAG TPA: hypothetical protein VL749_05700 [Patescibacteria group bacterium]|nr:hypothetical protein [Patescibacteria group bacterium]
MRHALRLPPRGRSGPWLIALGIGLVLAIQPIWRDNYAIGVTGLMALMLLVCARWQLRWLPVIVVIVCGVMLRWSVSNQEASDVSDVTRAAIMTMTEGGNPYGIGYVVSRPPGAAFPYGPVDLFWYLPFLQDPTQLEMLVTFVLLGFFGLRAAAGRPIGLVIFALAPPLVLASQDGSNDTSAGLFILIALALAAKRPALGAAALAVAVAFKPYALAWLPPLVLWAGFPAIVGFALASFVAWSPVLFVWGPGTYLRSLAMAQQTHLRDAYWSLASVWDGIDPGTAPRALETIRYFLSGAVAVLGGLRVRSIDGVIVVGAVAFMIAQFAGYFGSYVYIAAVAPLICYRVDDWLRHLLPELVHAYAEAPVVGRRIRRVTTPAPLPPPLRTAESATPARLASAIHAVPRSRSTRASRNLTG